MKQDIKKIVVLTGAGISAESGIKTFRDSNGLWEGHDVQEVATPEGFAANPALVQEFYNQRRAQLVSPETQANEAHEALARLEKEFDGEFLLVTQNVDDLHERGGSENIIHMHGELLKLHCTRTQQVIDFRGQVTPDMKCPCCALAGTLRPHIVWFGEVPLQMDRIGLALRKCDLFISIGTSGNVYPAAGFVQEASYYGAHTVELNLEPSSVTSRFSEQVYGPATQIVPNYVDKVLGLIV